MSDHSAVRHPNTDVLNKTGSKPHEDFRMKASEVLKTAQIFGGLEETPCQQQYYGTNNECSFS